MKGAEKLRIADFVHGTDGFGNIDMPEPQVSWFDGVQPGVALEACGLLTGEQGGTQCSRVHCKDGQQLS
jgi:hypothetical protein